MSNLTNAPSNSWWLENDATNHVVFTLQGFISKKKSNKEESKLIVGDN